VAFTAVVGVMVCASIVGGGTVYVLYRFVHVFPVHGVRLAVCGR